jgi:hypothetical protein
VNHKGYRGVVGQTVLLVIEPLERTLLEVVPQDPFKRSFCKRKPLQLGLRTLDTEKISVLHKNGIGATDIAQSTVYKALNEMVRYSASISN